MGSPTASASVPEVELITLPLKSKTLKQNEQSSVRFFRVNDFKTSVDWKGSKFVKIYGKKYSLQRQLTAWMRCITQYKSSWFSAPIHFKAISNRCGYWRTAWLVCCASPQLNTLLGGRSAAKTTRNGDSLRPVAEMLNRSSRDEGMSSTHRQLLKLSFYYLRMLTDWLGLAMDWKTIVSSCCEPSCLHRH